MVHYSSHPEKYNSSKNDRGEALKNLGQDIEKEESFFESKVDIEEQKTMLLAQGLSSKELEEILNSYEDPAQRNYIENLLS